MIEEKNLLWALIVPFLLVLIFLYGILSIRRNHKRELKRVADSFLHYPKGDRLQIEGMRKLLQWYYEIGQLRGEQAAIAIAFVAYLNRANELEFVKQRGRFEVHQVKYEVVFYDNQGTIV